MLLRRRNNRIAPSPTVPAETPPSVPVANEVSAVPRRIVHFRRRVIKKSVNAPSPTVPTVAETLPSVAVANEDSAVPRRTVNFRQKFKKLVNAPSPISLLKQNIIITPHIGIGDLIILKMSVLANNLNVIKINIKKSFVEKFTTDYTTKITFLQNLVKFLFPTAIFEINESNLNFFQFRDTYSLSYKYLYNDINSSMIKPNTTYAGCIVFHTKLRYDGYIDKFKKEYLPALTAFLKSFKTEKRILLLGERTIGQNIETIIGKTESLYDTLLLLKANNTVIDLTKDVLTEGTAIDEFLDDIEIINKAACNVTFGIGGPFSIANAFSHNKIACIPFIDASMFKKTCRSMHNNICTTVKELETYLLKHAFEPSALVEQPIPYDIPMNNSCKNNNILYLLNHKTLNDFEIPILLNNGYGVLTAKKMDGLKTYEHSINNSHTYDKFLKLENSDIIKLNDISWYDNITISSEIIKILNDNFKFIFVTLLLQPLLLNQLLKEYNGYIIYRFFGRESISRYKPFFDSYKLTDKVKFIFSYPEVLTFEQSIDSFFNSQNSFVCRLGLNDNFITKYRNTYSPVTNNICFIVSYSQINGYYKNIYNSFLENFSDYEYLLMGKQNINDKNAYDNPVDEIFYKKIAECKLMYYHSKEERHLHYHPLEGIIIGIPIIFHKESLLSSYLSQSVGKCEDMADAKCKINKILNNDAAFIDAIIQEQNKIIHTLTINYNNNIFNEILSL